MRPVSKLSKIQYSAHDKDVNQRIDKVLARLSDIGSRNRASYLLNQGFVLKDGKPLKPSYKVQEKDFFEIKIPNIKSEKILPYNFPLDIVYEDPSLLVVNKPSGLVVHPAAGHEQDTLVNALIHYTDDLSMGFHEKRPGIVHRLDKETSGLLVIAKDNSTHENLAQQFQKKSVHRIYEALVFGHLKQPSGRIETLLARHPTQRKKFASTQNKGKKAITHYQVLKEFHDLSLLQLRLETGRTHQIRVHLSEMGHPIVGDDTYGGVKRAKNLKSVRLRKFIQDMNRIALHAKELGFCHPEKEEQLMFQAPWPTDMSEIFELLGDGNECI